MMSCGSFVTSSIRATTASIASAPTSRPAMRRGRSRRRCRSMTPGLPGRRVAASNGQAEFRLFSPFRPERRHGNTQEPNASHDRKERFEQGVAELFELTSRPDRHLTGAAARDDLKVGELDLERDGAAANAGALAVVPYLVVKLHLHFKQCQHIGGYRRALARGAPRPAGLRAREGWCPTRSMWA